MLGHQVSLDDLAVALKGRGLWVPQPNRVMVVPARQSTSTTQWVLQYARATQASSFRAAGESSVASSSRMVRGSDRSSSNSRRARPSTLVGACASSVALVLPRKNRWICDSPREPTTNRSAGISAATTQVAREPHPSRHARQPRCLVREPLRGLRCHDLGLPHVPHRGTARCAARRSEASAGVAPDRARRGTS